MLQLPTAQRRFAEAGVKGESWASTLWYWMCFLIVGVALLRLAKAIFRCGAVPRGPALRQTSWRDLCLLRTERLGRWPCLQNDFERCRLEWLARNDMAPPSHRSSQPLPLPDLLQEQTTATMEELELQGVIDFAWQTVNFLNAALFDDCLLVDDVRIIHDPGEMKEAEEHDAMTPLH